MSDTSAAGLAFRLIGSLAVVVGLLFLLARVANKRMRTPTGRALTVVAKQSLSRSSGVAVVTVGARVLVVGMTEQQVSLLAELDPEELVVDEPEDAAEGADGVPGVSTDDLPADLAATDSPLAGSLLSAATWKQTLAAFSRAS